VRFSPAGVARGLLAALSGLALAITALASCDGEDPPPATDDAGPGTGGSSPQDGGTSDADGGEDASPPDASDAGDAPVILGVTPSPRSDQDGGPTPGEILDAELTTFAAGVRGVVVTRTLAELEQGGAAALEPIGDFYTAHGKQVLFNLALVDRAADGRPPPLAALPWSDPAVIGAVHAAVDQIVGSFDGLAYLTFGRDADVYLGAHPAERGSFEALARGACAYAGAHPAPPLPIGAGVGFSFEGATASDPSFLELLDAGPIVVLSYIPGLADGQAPPASGVAGALDGMAALAGGRPVVLQAAGYPSAMEAGSSDEKQRLFFETLFDALGPRRAAFPFVNVVELHDPSTAACEARVTAQGEDPGGAFARFACSLGLFDQAGADKPAWMEVATGAAAFASP
jgi:hypothetical protein